MDPHLKARNSRLIGRLSLVVFAMVGLSFASVPLYDVFCRVTGYGGTTQVGAPAGEAKVLDRTVKVRFNADTGRELPWHFAPKQKQIEVRIGETGVTEYFAVNRAALPVAGTALYNVTPAKAGRYFYKVQCFCFDEQILQPGARMDMPVYFFVDPAMAEDPNMDDVTSITLSYTFYATQSEALDDALEAFYNSDAPAPRHLAPDDLTRLEQDRTTRLSALDEAAPLR